MSLVRAALRIAAVQALMGRTAVGDNVLDSEMGSFEVDADGNLRTEEDRPFISIYTDAASTEVSGNNLRDMMANGATDILFEAGITAAMTETDPETDESVIIGIGTPATDAGFEFQLDLALRQVSDVLTDPENEWAEIFRGFIQMVRKVERARTSSTSTGIRVAGHQMKLNVLLLADPVRGVPLNPTSTMARFLAKAKTIEPNTVENASALQHAEYIEAQIAGQTFEWQTAMRRFGYTRDEAEALLLVPPQGAEADIKVVEIDTKPAEIRNG